MGAFDIRSTQGMMAGWMRRQTYVELQKGNGYTQPQLAGVETAVKSCIADATAFRFDVQYDELRLERSSGDLQSFSLVAEEPHVEGRDSNALLEDVFGVASRPEEVQAEIDELYRSIEDQDYPRARDQLAALRERLGPDDAAMIRATWLLDTEDPTSRASASSPPGSLTSKASRPHA